MVVTHLDNLIYDDVLPSLVSFPLASFSLSNLGPGQIHGAAPSHPSQVSQKQLVLHTLLIY